jgi:hypothetical protein
MHEEDAVKVYNKLAKLPGNDGKGIPKKKIKFERKCW